MALAMAVLVLAGFVLPARVDAQQAARVASVTLTPATATVGDRLSLEIAVDHSRGVTLEGPGFGSSFGGFELVAVDKPKTEGDGERTLLRYTLTSFVTGTATLPPLTIAWRDADGGSGTIDTPSRSVAVRSVVAPGDDEMRPLKPQVEIADGAPSPAVPALYVAIFAALTVLGYAMLRRIIAIAPPAARPPAPPPDPREIARTALDALASRGFDPAGADAWYETLAGTVRRFLSAQFDFPAYAMTRSELQRGMVRAGVDRWPARLAANLLEQCDAVQFAGFRPPPERAEADLTAAYEIVELSAPQEAPDARATGAEARPRV